MGRTVTLSIATTVTFLASPVRVEPGTGRWQDPYQMPATKTKKTESTRTGTKVELDLPWNVLLHNDWSNSMSQVVTILRKVIPGMTLKKATRIMWEAHTTGKAVIKSCHRELAELYEERLLAKGLSVSIEPAG